MTSEEESTGASELDASLRDKESASEVLHVTEYQRHCYTKQKMERQWMIWFFVWLGTMFYILCVWHVQENSRIEDELRSRLFQHVGVGFTEEDLNFAVEKSFH
jgi:hypothetical protein